MKLLSKVKNIPNIRHGSRKVSVIGWRPSYVGLIFIVLFLYVSLLPSLLPRPWLMQGVVSGLSMAIGYGIGLAVSALYRFFVETEVSAKTKQMVWHMTTIALPVLALIFLVLGIGWQNEVHRLLGTPEIDFGYGLLASLVALVLLMLCILLARLIRKLGRVINRFFATKVPPRVGVGLAISLTAFIVYYAVSGLLVANFYRVADNAFGLRDNTTPEGIVQPSSTNKSGSAESLIGWDKIGFQGRAFVGSGPSQEDIEEYTNAPALDPVRVYAGLASAETTEERAALAVQELVRTKAFEREVLIIATSTGTGWLDPHVVDAAEYLYGGDTAIVSQQYSYLPSWISFLVDQERAREAGRGLYDAVLEELEKLPEEQRPTVLTYGLSLGSFGGQEAFSGINDIRRSVDGALFVGSPNTSRIWRNTTDRRVEGSPEWQPMYRDGSAVRFASSREDIMNDPDKWTDETKILFLQHANDPVVWFSFDLIFNKPDWLGEPRGRAVSDSTRWFPIVSFLQVALDQAIAASAPIGQGHYYIDTPVYAWAAIHPPDGWSTEKSDALQGYLNDKFGDIQ